MATSAQIDQLRRLIAETEDAYPFTDAVLSDRIDAATSVFGLAADIWEEKSSAAAELVDISEGGSSRKQGDLYEQYAARAKRLRERDTEVTTPGTRGVVIRKLHR